MDESPIQRLSEVMQRLTEAMRAFGRALFRACERVIEAIGQIGEWLGRARAARGIAELEMDLKLRAEVGLRTDLLALFDP